MILMVVLGLVLAAGIMVTLWWGGTAYRAWTPSPDGGPDRPSVRTASLRVLRGTAVAIVGGFWAGALVTGPAIRLIMRLLAVTGGDEAQGRITDAGEVVGEISVDGTIGLYVFGGVLPGLVSGLLYAVLRHWLPAGRLGGVAFGALHLVVAATRLDPLRPENPDFDIVGPGWLSVISFGLAAVLHGMAVAAIANRYSHELPPRPAVRAAWARGILPLVMALLLLLPAIVVLVPIVAGVALTVALSQIPPLVRFARSRGVLIAGRVAIGLLALMLLPGALLDLRDVIVRDGSALPPPG